MDESAPPADLIASPWLTKDYLEEVLRNNCDDLGIRVESFEIRPSTTKGDNYASIIHRVAVTYVESNGQLRNKSLMIKSLPPNELQQMFLKEMQLFEKEIVSYSKIILSLNSLTGTQVLFPKFYATERPHTIILEDLSSRGFKMADRKKRLDLAHTSLALKALARFHALSYALIHKDPAINDLLPGPFPSERMKEIGEQFTTKTYKDISSNVGTWPGFERFSEKILSLINEIRKQYTEVILPIEGAFNVLNHGDFWVNNMLFRYNEETGNVEDVCFIDLQMIKYTTPAIDLHYFFTSSLADGIRDEHEDDLLEVYHQSLAETLETAGLDSSIYSLDDLKKDYEEKAPFGVHLGFNILCAVAADPNDVFNPEDITEEFFEEGSANPLGNMMRGEGYRHVLQQHLLHFEKKGVL